MKAQNDFVNLSREGTLLFLQEVDTLIANYASYCSFWEDTSLAQENAQRYLSLFESESSRVIDDINPNLSSNKSSHIRELSKPVKTYVEDLQRDFREYSSFVRLSDAASVAERIYQNDSATFFVVNIIKFSQGILKDSSTLESIECESDLIMLVRLHDTISYEMKISEMRKGGNLAMKWDYTRKKYKPRHVETHFNIKPVYSFIYSQGSNQPESPNKVIVNDNELFIYDYMNESDPYTSSFQGSAGVNGEMNFRFLWRKPSKNKTKGISIGVGAGLYNSFFQSDNYYEVRVLNDQDDDEAYVITSVSDFKESFMTLTVDIPISYSTEKWKNYRKGSFFSIGARLSYVSGTAKTSGSYTRKGYYPEYGILLEDMEPYGFVSDMALNNSYEPEFNPFNIAAELSFGRKKRSKSGKRVFYTGLTMGAYIFDIMQASSNTMLFGYDQNTHQYLYQGVLPISELARLGYVGLKFGVRRADPSESNLQRLKVERSPEYGSYFLDHYERVSIKNIEYREFPDQDLHLIGDLSKKERPVIFNNNGKDPEKFLDSYLKKRLKLSKEEETRIKKNNENRIQYSFIIDSFGDLRMIKIKNQESTEYGKEIYQLLYSTAEHWKAGKVKGKPTDTLFEMEFIY